MVTSLDASLFPELWTRIDQTRVAYKRRKIDAIGHEVFEDKDGQFYFINLCFIRSWSDPAMTLHWSEPNQWSSSCEEIFWEKFNFLGTPGQAQLEARKLPGGEMKASSGEWRFILGQLRFEFGLKNGPRFIRPFFWACVRSSLPEGRRRFLTLMLR